MTGKVRCWAEFWLGDHAACQLVEEVGSEFPAWDDGLFRHISSRAALSATVAYEFGRRGSTWLDPSCTCTCVTPCSVYAQFQSHAPPYRPLHLIASPHTLVPVSTLPVSVPSRSLPILGQLSGSKDPSSCLRPPSDPIRPSSLPPFGPTSALSSCRSYLELPLRQILAETPDSSPIHSHPSWSSSPAAAVRTPLRHPCPVLPCPARKWLIAKGIHKW